MALFSLWFVTKVTSTIILFIYCIVPENLWWRWLLLCFFTFLQKNLTWKIQKICSPSCLENCNKMLSDKHSHMLVYIHISNKLIQCVCVNTGIENKWIQRNTRAHTQTKPLPHFRTVQLISFILQCSAHQVNSQITPVCECVYYLSCAECLFANTAWLHPS